jgi:hypothetical protein
MRNLVLAIIVTVWGGAIVISAVVNGLPDTSTSYGTGRLAGILFGFVMFGAGVRHLIRHFGAPRA